MPRTRDGLPVIFAAAVPLLAMQVGVGFLRLQVRRKRGVRRFRRELVRAGMPKGQAARLAQTYHEAGSVRRLLRGVRLPGVTRS
jgi:hypothetical protein